MTSGATATCPRASPTDTCAGRRDLIPMADASAKDCQGTLWRRPLSRHCRHVMDARTCWLKGMSRGDYHLIAFNRPARRRRQRLQKKQKQLQILIGAHIALVCFFAARRASNVITTTRRWTGRAWARARWPRWCAATRTCATTKARQMDAADRRTKASSNCNRGSNSTSNGMWRHPLPRRRRYYLRHRLQRRLRHLLALELQRLLLHRRRRRRSQWPGAHWRTLRVQLLNLVSWFLACVWPGGSWITGKWITRGGEMKNMLMGQRSVIYWVAENICL